MLKARQGRFKTALADVAPRADDVGPDVNIHEGAPGMLGWWRGRVETRLRESGGARGQRNGRLRKRVPAEAGRPRRGAYTPQWRRPARGGFSGNGRRRRAAAIPDS